mmetsp:Transcript_5155/g.18864  ORF Transcript_5155/g.18864 Transcript_5155/m.18864 type:complete len:573 (+) Transcript_5155:1756-3474(+)
MVRGGGGAGDAAAAADGGARRHEPPAPRDARRPRRRRSQVGPGAVRAPPERVRGLRDLPALPHARLPAQRLPPHIHRVHRGAAGGAAGGAGARAVQGGLHGGLHGAHVRRLHLALLLRLHHHVPIHHRHPRPAPRRRRAAGDAAVRRGLRNSVGGELHLAGEAVPGRAQGAGQDEAAERVKRTRNNALHRRTSGRTGPCCERESDKRHQKTRARSHRLQVHDATSSHPPSKDARAALLAEAARLGAVLVQGGVGAEDVAIVLREELHGVQVGAALVCHLVARPRAAPVRRLVQAPAAAASPALLVVLVSHAEQTVAARRHAHLLEVLDVTRFGDEHLPAASQQPQASVLAVAHVLDAAAAVTVVRHPEVVTRAPGHVEVAALVHCHVVALVTARDGHEGPRVERGAGDAGGDGAVERGLHGLLHRRLPQVPSVAGHVDGSLVCCHLGLAALLDALDEHGHAGQLAVERNALPGAARVAGVQQDGWLAHDPTFVTHEADGVEAVVEALVCARHRNRLPRLSAVHRLQQRLARAGEEAAVGLVGAEGHVQQQHLAAHGQVDQVPLFHLGRASEA